MGGGARGGEYCGDDGIDTADRDYFATFELWGNEYAFHGSGAGASFTTFVFYEQGTEERSGSKKNGESGATAARND